MNARVLALLAALVFVVGVTWFVMGRMRAALPRGKPSSVENVQPARIESSLPALVKSAPLEPAREATSRAPGSSAADDEEKKVGALLDARLSVEVVALETGEPITGAGLFVDPGDEPPSADAHGRFRFAVQAGRRLQLTVHGPTGKAGSRALELDPLVPGETREVRVELPTAFDLDWFARVVDAEGGLPIAGARVEVFALPRPLQLGEVPGELQDLDVEAVSTGSFFLGGQLESLPRLDQATTDGDGRVVLRLPSWAIDVLRFDAEGYFSRSLAVCGATSAVEPYTLELLRTATLDARVLEADGSPATGVKVRLKIDPRDIGPDASLALPDVLLERDTDANGACSFDELPARAPIEVELARGGRPLLRPEERDSSDPRLMLEPGERAARTWQLELGCTLSGTVVDGAGAPIARLQLVLARSDMRVEEEFTSGLDPWDEGSIDANAFARLTTDAKGRFTHEAVPSGSWILVPEGGGDVPREEHCADACRIPAAYR